MKKYIRIKNESGEEKEIVLDGSVVLDIGNIKDEKRLTMCQISITNINGKVEIQLDGSTNYIEYKQFPEKQEGEARRCGQYGCGNWVNDPESDYCDIH